MTTTRVQNLPVYEIIIPCVIFVVIGAFHFYQHHINQVTSIRNARSFFEKVNEGWVKSNYMKEKASNTTRDYLRVSIFLAGNAIILATVLAGFASQVRLHSHKHTILS
jgi:hypothetical protein